MALPQSNGILTGLRGAGGTEDLNHPAGEGAYKWEGRIDVYVREKRERIFGQATTSVEIQRSLIVENAALTASPEADDTVEYTYLGQPVTATVDAVERSELEGMGPVATTRIHLRQT